MGNGTDVGRNWCPGVSSPAGSSTDSGVEVAPQSPMPVTEQRADARGDDWGGESQPGPESEGESVVHNGFCATVGFQTPLVAPLAHREHRRILPKRLSGLKFRDHKVVVVERQHAEEP